MSNLIDIQSQIEKLQKQANEIKAKEFHSTVQEILVKMQAFGITVKDLQTTKPSKGPKQKSKEAAPKAAKKDKKAGASVAAKYRGPNGETWSALIAQGQPKESFAIAPQDGATTSSAS